MIEFIVVTAVAAVACAMAWVHRSVLAPAPAFLAYWAIGLAAPLTLAHEFEVSRTTVLLLVACLASFAIGSACGGRSPLGAGPTNGVRPAYRGGPLRLLCVAGGVTGLASALLVQHAQGVPLSSLMSMESLLSSARETTIDRYSGALSVPTLAPLLLGITYAAAFLAPLAVSDEPSRLRRCVVLASPVAGASLYAVLTTARSGMLTALFLMSAGWLVTTLLTSGRMPRVRVRTVGIAVAIAGLFYALFVAIAFIRVGSLSPHYQTLLAARMMVYGFGYLPALSNWLDSGQLTDGPSTWGNGIANGVTKWFLPGAEDQAALPQTIVGNSIRDSTTVYSLWRTLLEDFGLIGTPLVLLVTGLLITRLWRRVSDRPSTASAVSLGAWYAFLLHSVTASVFASTNICLAFIIAGIALQWTLVRDDSAPKPRVVTRPLVAA